MLTIKPKDISVAQLHGYLLSAVAPRPIAFASTIDDKGNPNLSPFSFFNAFSANPPILVFSPARRVRNNTTKHTLENAILTKEVVINVVSHSMVQQMSLASTEYGKGVNEFKKAGFTMLKSDLVKPYRVAESPVQFECKINEIIKLGNQGGAGNLIVCEVVKLHIKREFLTEESVLNQEKLDLVARMGGNYYSRAKMGIFEIPKPIRNLGIGLDALPEKIRNSNVLTGNNLGMLGNIEALPTKQEINDFVNNSFEVKAILSTSDMQKVHLKAQEYLNNNEVMNALKLLLAL